MMKQWLTVGCIGLLLLLYMVATQAHAMPTHPRSGGDDEVRVVTSAAGAASAKKTTRTRHHAPHRRGATSTEREVPATASSPEPDDGHGTNLAPNLPSSVVPLASIPENGMMPPQITTVSRGTTENTPLLHVAPLPRDSLNSGQSSQSRGSVWGVSTEVREDVRIMVDKERVTQVAYDLWARRTFHRMSNFFEYLSFSFSAATTILIFIGAGSDNPQLTYISGITSVCALVLQRLSSAANQESVESSNGLNKELALLRIAGLTEITNSSLPAQGQDLPGSNHHASSTSAREDSAA